MCMGRVALANFCTESSCKTVWPEAGMRLMWTGTALILFGIGYTIESRPKVKKNRSRNKFRIRFVID